MNIRVVNIIETLKSLAGLNQRERFKQFIHGAEATRKNDERV